MSTQAASTDPMATPPPAPRVHPSGPGTGVRPGGTGSFDPPTPGPTPRPSRRSLVQLRAVLADRLPELLATAGVALLVAAVAGFVVSQWTALDNLGQAGLLVAGSVVLTVQGTWSARRPGRLLHRLVPLSWGAAAGLTLVATQLLLELGLPSSSRLAIAGAGMVAAAHAAWLWTRRPDSVVLQVAAVASAIYAAGPIGISLADAWDSADVLTWSTVPFLAIFGLDAGRTDAFAVVAAGHLLVAVAWVAVGLRLDHPVASRTGRIGGALLLAWSALELNAVASPVGTSLALLVVLGFLVVGVALEDGLLIGFGAMAGLVTGLRTIWSLFNGETAVTLTVAVAGVALVLAALRLGRARDNEAGAPAPDAPAPGATGSAAEAGTAEPDAPGTADQDSSVRAEARG